MSHFLLKNDLYIQHLALEQETYESDIAPGVVADTASVNTKALFLMVHVNASKLNGKKRIFKTWIQNKEFTIKLSTLI
jgi:hypothetical protein